MANDVDALLSSVLSKPLYVHHVAIKRIQLVREADPHQCGSSVATPHAYKSGANGGESRSRVGLAALYGIGAVTMRQMFSNKASS